MKNYFKYFIILISIGFLTVLSCHKLTPPSIPSHNVIWEKTYGGSNNDLGVSIQKTYGNGYIIAGLTESFGSGEEDVYLIKTDANGDSLWAKTYGGEYDDAGISVQQTSDGCFIITGYAESFGSGGKDVYLIKTDANGDSLWAKTYGGSETDRGLSVLQVPDEGFIIAGYTESFSSNSTSDIYLIKTDINGNLLWEKTYGGTDNDRAQTVQKTSDGCFIIVGYTESFGSGEEDVYLIKTDANGDSLWAKTYGGEYDDIGISVQQSLDGEFIIAGYTSSFGEGQSDVYLIKTDANGDSLWAKTYGTTFYDMGYSICETPNGGYIIVGLTQNYSNYDPIADVYLTETTRDGELICSSTYGGDKADKGYSVVETSDGGYIIAGETSSFGSGLSDVYLIKIK